jgi:hypothetical protein
MRDGMRHASPYLVTIPASWAGEFLDVYAQDLREPGQDAVAVDGALAPLDL